MQRKCKKSRLLVADHPDQAFRGIFWGPDFPLSDTGYYWTTFENVKEGTRPTQARAPHALSHRVLQVLRPPDQQLRYIVHWYSSTDLIPVFTRGP